MAPSDEKAPLTSPETGFFGHIKEMLLSSLGKIFIFLFVVVPIMFISLMMVGGHLMSYTENWEYQRGYNFMAGAITGGAIVFPADPPTRTTSKIWASIAGAAGVSMFGFIVATLSNSLVDPIIHIFGLDHLERSVSGVYGKLAGLAAIVMAGNCFFALIFGGLFSWYEEVGFYASFKAIASIELGGGVVFHDQASPHTAGGTLLYTVVGVWAIGVGAVMVSIAGGPATGVMEDKFELRLKEGATVGQACSKLAFLVLVILPVSLLTVMFGVACVMEVFTVWNFEGAFWTALPATTGGAAALGGPPNPPLSNLGVVMLICAASAGFFLVSVFIGVGAELMGPIIDNIKVLQAPKDLAGRNAVLHALVALVIISFVVVPLAVFSFAVPVGAVLSHSQGWELHQGFWWCVAVQLGGGMALTSVVIKDLAGMFIGVCAVAWSIGISILTVGLAGSPVVTPLMDALGLSVDEAELQAVLDRSRESLHLSTGYPSAEEPKGYGSAQA